jgi:preprotein translocase subunit YajC
MLIAPAYAQAGGAPGGFDLISLMPLLLIFVVFYFLLIRPQQTKVKQHRAMVEGLKKGDQIATAGGIVGKVTRVDAGDNTLMVEIAPNVQVKVVRHTVADLLSKPVPASGNDNRAASAGAGGAPAPTPFGGFLGKLMGKK